MRSQFHARRRASAAMASASDCFGRPLPRGDVDEVAGDVDEVAGDVDELAGDVDEVGGELRVSVGSGVCAGSDSLRTDGLCAGNSLRTLSANSDRRGKCSNGDGFNHHPP